MTTWNSGTERKDLIGLEPAHLAEEVGTVCAELREPAYRARQIAGWIYTRRAISFEEMTDLPAGLREELTHRYSLSPLHLAWEAQSVDGTLKHLWSLRDGEQVESVLIPSPDRVTLCLSSQAGCALGCRFCATGDYGFRRQLSAAEIVAQYRDSDRISRERFGREIGNLVYMGMGEPLANLEPVMDSLSVLHRGFGLGARRITVSTVGLIPGIRALAGRPEPFRLAVSLHAPNHALRLELVPVEQRYPLPALFEALREYGERKGRRITFEYTLIEGVNDAPDLARELLALLAGLDAFVNLIPYNPIPGRAWAPSRLSRARAFLGILERGGVAAAIREPRGRDIAAACGQLRLERAGAATQTAPQD